MDVFRTVARTLVGSVFIAAIVSAAMDPSDVAWMAQDFATSTVHAVADAVRDNMYAASHSISNGVTADANFSR